MDYGNGTAENIHLRESTEFCCQDFCGVLYCFWEEVEEVDVCEVFAACEADSLGYVGLGYARAVGCENVSGLLVMIALRVSFLSAFSIECILQHVLKPNAGSAFNVALGVAPDGSSSTSGIMTVQFV